MKAGFLKIIIGSLFLIMFNVGFFLIFGTECTTTEWVCYGFIHAAYLCLLSTPLLCNAGKGETVLSATLYLQALFYFFIELVVGIGCLYYYYRTTLLYNTVRDVAQEAMPSVTEELNSQSESYVWYVIIQGALLTIFLIMQLIQVMANDATKASLAKQRRERVYVRSLAENVKEAMHKISDSELRKQMKSCYEALNSVSIESLPEAAAAETELENAVDALCAAIDKDATEQISHLIQNVQVALRHRSQAIRMARYS